MSHTISALVLFYAFAFTNLAYSKDLTIKIKNIKKGKGTLKMAI